MKHPASNPVLRQFVSLWLYLLLASTALAQESFTHGLLWEVRSGDAAPVYVFGTMHSEDPRITRLPDAVTTAFEASERLVLEVELDAAAIMSLGTGMLFSDGRTLDAVLDADLYLRTLEAMAALGIPEMIVARMKPWAVATTLMMPETRTGLFLDRVLYELALERGMRLGGLETAAEQLAVFEDLDLGQQIALLEQAVEQRDEYPAMLEQLVQAYLERDLAKMQRLSDESMAGTPGQLAERLNRTLLIDRNRRMADRMKPLLEEGDVFIAVGALHLPGEQGILSLLARQGYEVRVLY